jgi:uncharacterized Zn finger protein (UPF0148 family)
MSYPPICRCPVCGKLFRRTTKRRITCPSCGYSCYIWEIQLYNSRGGKISPLSTEQKKAMRNLKNKYKKNKKTKFSIF